MSNILRFSDKMEFDLTGPLRIEERPDGLYVIGEGLLCAVDNEDDGIEFIQGRRPGKCR